MPAFDPVRDAVLNSPLTRSPVISSYPFPSPYPAGPSNASPSPLISSPSLPRRATDLSVLLNADDAPRPLRRSSLTHLLHPTNKEDNDDDDNKFTTSQLFQRQEPELADDEYRPITSSSSHLTAPSPSPFPDSPQSSVLSRPPSRSASSLARRQPPPAPPTMALRPTPSPRMPPPPLPPTSIPYNPTKRISPPTTVLKPLTPEEIAMYRKFEGQGTRRLRKRKRAEDSQDADARDQPPAKKAAGDHGVVVDHYNARPDVGVVQRQDSPIIGLKNFNNWVKSVLISRFAHPALLGIPITQEARPPDQRGKRLSGRVMDIGCGKGGDLTKWMKARIGDYLGLDIAAVSVDQARQRWEGLHGQRFCATFKALDCYGEFLDEHFESQWLKEPLFDVVSMQFCMHYAFDDERRVRLMLQNVSEYLRHGGAFIGTIPSHEFLMDRLAEIPSDQEELSFGNSVYKIQFESREKTVYGHKYWFFLRDAVEYVPEYVVQWEPFEKLANEYGLHLIYKKEFHHVFEDFQEHPEFGPLMVRMKVVDEQGETSMDEDQWETANLYIAFAFERRPHAYEVKKMEDDRRRMEKRPAPERGSLPHNINSQSPFPVQATASTPFPTR